LGSGVDGVSVDCSYPELAAFVSFRAKFGKPSGAKQLTMRVEVPLEQDHRRFARQREDAGLPDFDANLRAP
jgi:hypothetical protein